MNIKSSMISAYNKSVEIDIKSKQNGIEKTFKEEIEQIQKCDNIHGRRSIAEYSFYKKLNDELKTDLVYRDVLNYISKCSLVR